MGAVNRTAQCKKCGSVNLKIKQNIGSVFYYCAECGSSIEQVMYEKYQTALSTCEKCGKDIFKGWITVDKGNELHEYWDAKCINCNSMPKTVYVDNEGNLISNVERELLIRIDKIEELEEEDENNKSIISSLKYEKEDLSYEIEEKDSKIYDLERELYSANKEIENLKRKVSQLEDEVYYLEYEINRY
ncbi:hypothetical protein [Clostridium nigeriense]|uniref:hypothetical protein n=1 Tax=Clostridium nigeriense TaxID=1805470 RepID=UPI00082FABBB|nr:hypothetical protein [Clostridium nigeriense]